jgi:hypothetical protein
MAMTRRGDFLSIDQRKLRQVAGRGAGLKVREITVKTAVVASTIAPGSMKQAVRPIISGTKNAPFGIVMVDHPAAGFVLNGTKAHPIFPSRKKVLRFVVGGRVVYSKRVDHPGTKPNNFLMKAMLIASGRN